MSFGFSVGDFLTARRLISDIVTSLRAASVAEYRELICELHGLQRALHEIEHLKCTSSQEAVVNGIKVAAVMCLYPLDDFSAKLKKFERLGFDGGKTRSRLDTMKIWTRKLQGGFFMEEEVEKLRTYTLVHVGSLNMRLINAPLNHHAPLKHHSAPYRTAIILARKWRSENHERKIVRGCRDAAQTRKCWSEHQKKKLSQDSSNSPV